MPKKYFVLVLVGVLGLASCSAPVDVTVTNKSNRTLSEVNVIAGRVSRSIADIERGREGVVSIRPESDSALELIFSAEPPNPTKCNLDVYLTRGMSGQIKAAINEDFSCVLHSDDTTVR